jgi:hypothetical protein
MLQNHSRGECLGFCFERLTEINIIRFMQVSIEIVAVKRYAHLYMRSNNYANLNHKKRQDK